MLRKRLIGVVTVKAGWAVQSFGYRRWLPLGRPEVLVENLDRWGADEILLQCIDRSAGALGPDLELLERVARGGLSTPLIYGGGIRTADDAIAAIKSGADRVCVDALLHRAPQAVAQLSGPLGAQAVIAALPLSMTSHGMAWLDHRSGKEGPVTHDLLETLRAGTVSEALVIDWRNEGQPCSFDIRLLREFPVKGIPLIAFGGLSDPQQMRGVLEVDQVSAIGVGNFLNYREVAVHEYKAQLSGLPLRPSSQ